MDKKVFLPTGGGKCMVLGKIKINNTRTHSKRLNISMKRAKRNGGKFKKEWKNALKGDNMAL